MNRADLLIDLRDNNFQHAADIIERQNARIAELEANRAGWEAEAQKNIRLTFEQSSRIAELEKIERDADAAVADARHDTADLRNRVEAYETALRQIGYENDTYCDAEGHRRCIWIARGVRGEAK